MHQYEEAALVRIWYALFAMKVSILNYNFLSYLGIIMFKHTNYTHNLVYGTIHRVFLRFYFDYKALIIASPDITNISSSSDGDML